MSDVTSRVLWVRVNMDTAGIEPATNRLNAVILPTLLYVTIELCVLQAMCRRQGSVLLPYAVSFFHESQIAQKPSRFCRAGAIFFSVEDLQFNALRATLITQCVRNTDG